jgi:hypothetical protein
LTTNWSDIFQQNFQQPKTAADAIGRLMTVLEGEHKTAYPDVASGMIAQALWIN